MKQVFKKLTKRTFINNFKQFISVILIVFLASMLLVGLITNYTTLNGVINTYFEETNLADAWLYVDNVSSEDESYLNSLNIKFDKRYYFESNLIISDSSVANNGKVYVYDGKISNPYKESGMWGCVIDKKVAQDNNIKVGYDEVQLNLKYPINGQEYEVVLNFLITGTGSLDECADVNTSWPIFISKELFLSEVNSAIYLNTNDESLKSIDIPYNQVLIKLNEKETRSIDEILSDITNYYESSSSTLNYSFKQDTIDSVIVLTDEIKQTKKMIYIFPILFLFVSILITFTTIDQLVLQEKQKIGTLKSIGIPNKKIMNHYSKFGAILCLIGSTIGSFIGVIMIPSIMFIKYHLVYSLPNEYMNLVVPYKIILIVIIGITLLGYIVARLACRSIIRRKPIDCLKFQVNNSKAFSSNKKRNIMLKKLPFSIKMSIRNIKLKPIRTFMVIVGIAGCFALLLCGYGIKDTLNKSVKYDLSGQFKYDITTTYNSDSFEDDLSKIESITTYEKYQKMYVSAKSSALQKGINLYKIAENSTLTNLKITKGEVLISSSLADDFLLKIGDEILVSISDKTISLRVSKIMETTVINGIFVCDDIDFDDIYKINGAWIKCDNVNKDIINYINKINGTNTAATMEKSISDMNIKISAVSGMTNTLKIFAILLAIIVLLNLVFLILKERVREIATLKVIGTTMSSIVFSLFFEILFMGLIGSFVGMFFGYPLLVAVLSINKVNVINYVYHIKFVSFIWAYLIVFMSILFIMLLCYIKVKKINMIESLKSME